MFNSLARPSWGYTNKTRVGGLKNKAVTRLDLVLKPRFKEILWKK
jgi:hypothetical protein